MSDLLIRNLDPELKRKLHTLARRHGHSLSEEAKALLNRALVERSSSRPVGSALIEHFRRVRPIDLDVRRDELPESPPRFE